VGLADARVSGEETSLLAQPLTLRGLSPDDERARMLQGLQANILQAHVRTHLRLLALRIDGPYAARRGLADIARSLKSAALQADELQAYRESGTPGTAYVGIALSATGYERLQVPLRLWPPDHAFREGVVRRDLGDPPRSQWEAPYRHGLDALVLVGSHSDELTAQRVREVLAELGASVTVLADEVGRTLTNANGDAIEHFGYADGRSQPLFVEEDLERELLRGGVEAWNPLVPLEHVLVPDAATGDADCFGSYLVYRKSEQNVRAFREQETRVAGELGLATGETARGGALLVGRFEDGTPVALDRDAAGADPIPNDFTFAGDPDGARCPLAAHVRRMNTRPTAAQSRTVLARRGQSYGVRTDNPNDPDPASKPTGGVGLLFLAVMAGIQAQFETLQAAANGDDGGPFDPIAGQWRDAATTPEIALRRDWDEAHERAQTLPLEQVVRFRGGEYLFLPSIPFLRSLAHDRV
jgi:Dyp-type peroxidase family